MRRSPRSLPLERLQERLLERLLERLHQRTLGERASCQMWARCKRSTHTNAFTPPAMATRRQAEGATTPSSPSCLIWANLPIIS